MNQQTVTDGERWYATRDDAGCPTVVDWQFPSESESMPGSSMWDAKWTAAHYNGQHDMKRHDKCPECSRRGF